MVAVGEETTPNPPASGSAESALLKEIVQSLMTEDREETLLREETFFTEEKYAPPPQLVELSRRNLEADTEHSVMDWMQRPPPLNPLTHERNEQSLIAHTERDLRNTAPPLFLFEHEHEMKVQ